MSWLDLGTLGPMGARSDRFGTYGLGSAGGDGAWSGASSILGSTVSPDLALQAEQGLVSLHNPDGPVHTAGERVPVNLAPAGFQHTSNVATGTIAASGAQTDTEYRAAMQAASRAPTGAQQAAAAAAAVELVRRQGRVSMPSESAALAQVRAAQEALRRRAAATSGPVVTPGPTPTITRKTLASAPPPAPAASIRTAQTQVAPWRTVGIVAGMGALGLVVLLIAGRGR